MAWRIFYSDGTTYDGSSGPMECAPCDGVIVIVQADAEVGRELLHMRDFYYWEHGRWFGCDLYGLFDYLRRPGWKKTLAGRNVTHQAYHTFMQRAAADPAFLPKSARLTGELPERAPAGQ